MADVRLSSVRKQHGSGANVQVAVHDLDLHVADGEFVVLVGPSGCGKSTILRMIAGLEAIDEGELRIGDVRMNETAPGDRDIAMVFQTYALYPHMTVFDNLAFALKLRGVRGAALEARVHDAARAMHIEALLPRFPRALSGGERQRVALGRALVRQPRVFLFDEPLSNLDARLRVEMRREIARLHETLGTTMIYVTHDQVEAMTLGDRIVVLREGRVQQVDTPSALYERPATEFVAGFIGSPGMNLLNGSVQSHDGELRIVNGGGMSLVVPAQWRAVLRPRAGTAVRVGVRPEHLRLAAEPARADLTTTVDLVEHLGNDSIAHGRADGADIAVRCSAHDAPARGTMIPLVADPERLHFFDPATSRRLDP